MIRRNISVSKLLKIAVGLLATTAISNVFAQELPIDPERRFSVPAIVECVKNRTAGMKVRFKSLEDQSNALRRANASVAPVVLQRRRLEEEWCTAEAQCASEVSKENKQLVYGEIFNICFRKQ